MLKKYSDAEAVITVEGRSYALYKKGSLKEHLNPCMIDVSTGEIPYRDQLPLLKSYLLQSGVNVAKTWTTHRCIYRAIEVAQTKEI